MHQNTCQTVYVSYINNEIEFINLLYRQWIIGHNVDNNGKRPFIFTKTQEEHLSAQSLSHLTLQQPYQVSTIVIPPIQMKEVRLGARFLNPGTVDVLDQKVLCYGGDVLCIVRCLAASLVSIC